MVSRLLWEQEIAGSTPAIPTIQKGANLRKRVTKNSKKKILWSNRLNLSGLYSDEPIKCFRTVCKFDRKKITYWEKAGNYETTFAELGEIDSHNGRSIKFTSQNKKEVEMWTKGVKAAFRAMQRYCEEKQESL